MPERSLCWRSLNDEPVVWVGDRVWRKGHLPYAFLMLLWNFAFNASGRGRFHFDSSQTVFPHSGSRVRDRVAPQSWFPAPLCFWLGSLCPGGWRGRELELASPPNAGKLSRRTVESKVFLFIANCNSSHFSASSLGSVKDWGGPGDSVGEEEVWKEEGP